MTPDEIREVSISIDEIARAIRERLAIEGPSKPRGWAARRVATPETRADAPLSLGAQGDTAGRVRDVVWFPRPTDEGLETLLERSERVARPTLVLVGTADLADPKLRARHGPGAHVELDVLADLFFVEDATIRLAPRLRVVAHARGGAPTARILEANAPDTESIPPKRSASPPKDEPLATKLLPTAGSWRDVRMAFKDGETITVRIGNRAQDLTYIDLGLATKGTRKPTKPWKLLVACCQGGGRFLLEAIRFVRSREQAS